MVSTMVIGPGRVNLSLRLVWARAALASARWTEPLRRDLCLVAVGADADRLPAVEIDAVEIGEKAVDEMDARLLAVAHDVDSRILLQLHREDRGVDLARRERGPLQPPGGPELFRFSEPRGLRQAAGDGGFEHGGYPGL
jgi:hypothetical protein